MQTRVVNVKSGEPYDIYIGRANARYGLKASKWANPFRVGDGYTRQESIRKYSDEHLPSRPDLLAALPELKGKTLACWCSPLRCHGDALAEMAEGVS